MVNLFPTKPRVIAEFDKISGRIILTDIEAGEIRVETEKLRVKN